MRVLGIDAAWTYEQPSGVCLLEEENNSFRIIKLSPSYINFISEDENLRSKPIGSKANLFKLLEKFSDSEIDCIAVDMPLSETLITGRRSCENQVSRAYGAKGASTHTPNSERPGKISVDIVSDAKTLGYSLSLLGKKTNIKPIIEVYPHTSIIEYLDLDYRYEYKVAKKNSYST